MTTFLVTGGAGFIGSTLAEALLAQGDTVRILDDFSSGRRSNIEALRGKLDVIEGSIVDEATVRKAMQGAEVVFHEAAIPSVPRSVEKPQASMLANVQGTTVVLDVARQVGVRRLVFAASSSAYGDTPTLPKIETMTPQPKSPYAISKLAGEQLLTAFSALYGLETLSLRYFNVFGPEAGSDEPVRRGHSELRHGGARGQETHRLRRRRADARLLLRRERRPREHSRGDHAEEAQRRGREHRVRRANLAQPAPHDHRRRGRQEGRRPSTLPSRVGDVRDSLASIDAARELIGYEPKVKVREGLKKTIPAFR